MFFVLTTGRSGSTSIASALNMVPGCHAVHEPAPELILESAGYRYGEVTPEKIQQILRKTRSSTVGGSVYCESNQTLSLIIPELVTVFPEARFIWLVRNGLDVVASAYQKQWYTGHSENNNNYEECTPLEKAWIDGRVRADRLGEMGEFEWNALSRFEKCCWYWGYVNRVIGADLEYYAPSRYYLLRLEEVGRDLPRLLAWMGVPQPGIPIVARENIAKRIPFHWTEWSAEQHQSFVRWCKEEMDRFYPSWQNFTDGNGKVFVAPALSSLRERIQMLEADLKEARFELEGIKRTKVWKVIQRLKRLESLLKGQKW